MIQKLEKRYNKADKTLTKILTMSPDDPKWNDQKWWDSYWDNIVQEYFDATDAYWSYRLKKISTS